MAKIAMKKRNLYLAKIEASLTQYNARLSELRGKAAEVQADMKLEYLSQVENLEKKRDEFKEKHDRFKIAGAHAWKDVKTGTGKAWHKLEYSVEKAVSRFK